MSLLVQAATRRMLACASAAAAMACVLAPARAHAAVTAGAYGIITDRPCTAPYAQACDLSAPRTAASFGGLQSHLTAAYGFPDLAIGLVGAAPDPGSYLPTIRAESLSSVASRTGATVTSFQTFTYYGASAIDLALTGNLHFIGGGGHNTLNVAFGIMGLSDIASFGPRTSLTTLLSDNHLNFPDCADGAIASSGYTTSGVPGDFTVPISLTTSCSGNNLTVHNGDSFVVVATMQAISDRGGYMDASHTFTVAYDTANTFYAGTTNVVDPSVFTSFHAGVPEPASWALMILGFGATGAALGRRRAAALS